MIQKKFLCKDLDTARTSIGQIDDVLKSTAHKCAVITFYEKGFTAEEIESLVECIKKTDHPELLVAGISATVIAELMPEGTGIVLNLILTEKADIEVVTVPCIPGGEAEAAETFRAAMDAYSHVRAVEFFASNFVIDITSIIATAMKGHEDAVLFGTSTLRNLFSHISVEAKGDGFEVEKEAEAYDQNEFVAGSSLLTDGFVAVIFAGDDLKVCSNYALGWEPVGRKLDIGFVDSGAAGGTVIGSINGLPAVDIYREYLGVYPDPFLISNVCEFPFVVEREGINICLIPIDFGKDGELRFMMKLDPAEKIRFTFASHDEVLYASRNSREMMERFVPEALFLTLCGNRLNFLKEDAHIEWDEFGTVCPDNALMHGACELFYHNGQGGILNSAHLAIGLREGDDPKDVREYDHPTLESLRHERVLSLSDRMSVFLSKITTELVDIAKEADDANKAKSAFLSHMSHEIRTPINAILGMNEMILQDSKEDETLEYAESIRSAGSDLLGIVNDVLDFSKIEAGKMKIVAVEYEIKSVINDMYNMVRMRAADKGLTFKFDIDPSTPSVLFGDETRIKQIITNLLTNAVKYTEKGSVTLIVRPVSVSGEKAVIRVAVKDTGIGIRPEDMEKLFDEYERFDEKRNKAIEGTGLGLSITRQLLDLMGSRLTVESTYGEGSEFGFEIVQGVVNAEPVGDMSDRFKKSVVRKYRFRFTAEDARILVVDDTSVNLTVIKNLLKNTKITVDTASSGEDALRLVRDVAYDMIFLDHFMPGMNGPETLRRLNEDEENLSKSAPVISLTADASATARDEYIRAGFKDYLAKPISLKELEDMLFYYLPPEKIRTIPLDQRM